MNQHFPVLVASLLVACASPVFAQTGGVPAARAPDTAVHAHDAPSWKALAVTGGPTARHESSFVQVDGKGYLFGGRGERPLEVFDPASARWTTAARPPIELHHAQGVGFDGKVLVVSALVGAFLEESSLQHVLVYDPKADRWSTGPAIPEARRRGASGVVEHGGLIYVIGGNTRGHNSGYVPWLDVFDPASSHWKALADAPHARDHFQAVAVDGKLYAAGGRRSSHDTGEDLSLTIGALDVYDIEAGTWSTEAMPLPTQRAGTAAALVGRRVAIIGGESGAQQAAHREVEAYDLDDRQWHVLPPLPKGRHGTQAARFGDTVHVVAGSADRGGGPELNDHWVLE